jgi:predicted molibdopterin-dependent oxidoreductase YjgC
MSQHMLDFFFFGNLFNDLSEFMMIVPIYAKVSFDTTKNKPALGWNCAKKNSHHGLA